MKLDFAAAGDAPEMKALYRACFFESEAETDAAFAAAFAPGSALVAREGGALAAMLMFPRFFCADAAPGGYVYSACTAPAHRGRGLMPRLLAMAEEEMAARGDGFSFLVPGEKSLFDYYRRFGYETGFYKNESSAAPGGAADLRKAEERDYPGINLLYEEKYKSWRFLKRSAEFYKKIEGMYGLSGGGIFVPSSGAGYAVAASGGEALVIKEFFGEDMPRAVASHFRRPALVADPARAGAEKGMVKPLTPEARDALAGAPLCFNLLFD